MPLPETGLNWIFPQGKWGPLSAPNPALGHFPPHLQNITPDPKGHCRNPAFQFAGDVFYTLWTSPGNTLISEKPNVSQDAYNVAHPGVQNARGPCNAPHSSHSHLLSGTSSSVLTALPCKFYYSCFSKTHRLVSDATGIFFLKRFYTEF